MIPFRTKSRIYILNHVRIYPDGHPYITGDVAHLNVENGLIQTGIAYPRSSNGKRSLAFSQEHIGGQVIEFACNKTDLREFINPDEYELLKMYVWNPVE